MEKGFNQTKLLDFLGPKKSRRASYLGGKETSGKGTGGVKRENWEERTIRQRGKGVSKKGKQNGLRVWSLNALRGRKKIQPEEKNAFLH